MDIRGEPLGLYNGVDGLLIGLRLRTEAEISSGKRDPPNPSQARFLPASVHQIFVYGRSINKRRTISPSLGDEERIARPHSHRPAAGEYLPVAGVPAMFRGCKIDCAARSNIVFLREVISFGKGK